MKFRKATMSDLTEIVLMLANDPLGKSREDVSNVEKYTKALARIAADENQELIVVENEQGVTVGTFQLTFIQYLTHQGSLRVLVEAVRVKENFRGQGIGEKIFQWIIHHAKEKGADLLQLTSDKQRPDAIRFYTKLGFAASHEGLKLKL